MINNGLFCYCFVMITLTGSATEHPLNHWFLKYLYFKIVNPMYLYLYLKYTFA